MPKPSPLDVERFTFKFNKCTLPKGELYDVRFFQKGKPLKQAMEERII